MGRFLLRRVLSLFPVLVIVSALTFFGLELVPGDPLLLALGPGAEAELGNMSPEEYQRLLQAHGLDKPVLERYVNYVGGLLQGDFGRSRVTQQTVAQMFRERLPVTLWLNSITLVTNVVFGVVLGTIAGMYAGTKIDLAATMVAVLSVATPGFWIAIMSIIVFSLWLGWLPSSGWVDPLHDPIRGLKHLILPIFALGVFGSASILRQTRSSIIEVMRQDYVVTARAKGLTQYSVVTKHMLKNALLPVVTLLGFQVAALISGSVLIERVFGLPGVGRMALDATQRADYTVVQAVVMMSAVAIIAANLLADVLYAVLDPRIRYR